MARTEAGLPAGIRVIDHISVGVLTASVPLDVVRAVLQETQRASERERVLPARKLPRQAHSCKSDAGNGVNALGKNVSGGTRPRASWARSVL